MKDDWEKPRSHGTRLTEAEIARVRQGFVNGERIESVARELACSSRTVTKYYGLWRAAGGVGSDGASVRAAARPMTEEQLRRYRASLPPDTRDLTARFCGDPPPGRSVLDQRKDAP